MKLKQLFFAIASFVIITNSGCNCNNQQKKIDEKVAAIKVDLKVNRFDKDLFLCHKQNDFSSLKKKIPCFF